MLLRHARFRIIFAFLLITCAICFAIYGNRLITQAAKTEMSITPRKIGLSYVRRFSLGFSFKETDASRTWVVGISSPVQKLVAYNNRESQFWVFDLTGRKIASFGKAGMRPGEFMTPSGLAFDQNGNLLVADESIPVIRRYQLNGQYINDATPTVPNVAGWSDVAWHDGIIIASPSIFSAYHHKQGIRLFKQGKSQEICKHCFGPVALDANGLIYLVDKMTPPSEPVLPHLMVFSQTGNTMLRAAFPMVGIVFDIQYWPEVNGFITTYSGKDTVLLIRDKGRTVEKLLDIADKSILTLLPMYNELYVVHTDGQVEVFKLQIAK